MAVGYFQMFIRLLFRRRVNFTAMFTRTRRMRTHTLTIISICSTLVYLGFFHSAVIQDFFARTEIIDDYQPLNEVERRGTLDKSSVSAWSYERRRDSAETSLKKLAPQLFNALPEPFSSKMKNPCWNLRKNKRQCLPYFYLIGMPKCGTTDLWNKLIRHPYIAETKKEPHWWSRIRIGHGHVSNHSKLNANPVSYYSRFANAIDKYAKKEGLNKSKIVVGDGSASTMWDNRSWRYFYPNATRGPAHVLGELIISIQPKALAIAILRNPTDRLYSDYLYFTNTSMLTPEYFHERVKTSMRKFHECTKNLDVRTCTYETQGIKSYVRLEVGLYSIYVGDWLSFFPRKKLKIIKMADWHQKCSTTLSELYQFLALEPLKIPSLIEICQDEAGNARSPQKLSLGPMLPETRQLLDDFYAPYNRELASMLRDDRFLWNDKGAGSSEGAWSSEESVP